MYSISTTTAWVGLVILIVSTAFGGYLAAGRILAAWSKQTLDWSRQTFEKHEKILERIEGSITKLLVLGAENRTMIESHVSDNEKLWRRIEGIERRIGPVDRRKNCAPADDVSSGSTQ
jgi:hypothetical protein